MRCRPSALLGRIFNVTAEFSLPPALLLTAIVCASFNGSDEARAEDRRLPAIHVNDPSGTTREIPDDELFAFERDLRKQVAAEKGPTEIIALATSMWTDFMFRPRGSRETIRRLCVVRVYGNRGRLEVISDYGKKRNEKQLSAEQVGSLRKFIATNSVDDMPPLEGIRKVGDKTRVIVRGTLHVYFHVTRDSGHRATMNNPDDVDPGEIISPTYSMVVKFFGKLVKEHTANGTKPRSDVIESHEDTEAVRYSDDECYPEIRSSSGANAKLGVAASTSAQCGKCDADRRKPGWRGLRLKNRASRSCCVSTKRRRPLFRNRSCLIAW